MPADIRIGPTFDFTDAAPMDICRIAVLFIACDLAGAAADALRHIEVEAVLFAGRKWTIREERGRRLLAERSDCDAHEFVADSDALM
jgi:hypothetical protein